MWAKRQPAAPMTGVAVARRMTAALLSQARVQVRGRMSAPGSQAVSYLLRYQAKGREYLEETGGAWSQVQIGKRHLTGLQAVSVGKLVYTTTDGTHWMKGSRLTPPTPLDVISLNPANAPCCVPSNGTAASVSNLGVRAWHARQVYRLSYTASSVTATIRGTVIVDTRSYLPLEYTETSRAPALTGTFTLSYGGTFTINEPASH
jgi:hypothetical protein